MMSWLTSLKILRISDTHTRAIFIRCLQLLPISCSSNLKPQTHASPTPYPRNPTPLPPQISNLQHTMDPREREAKEAKARQRQQLLDRAYDEVVAKQLEKLNAKKTFTEDDEELYRQKLSADREKAASKKRKAISAEQAELARTTGLSGQVVAMMAGHDEIHSDGENEKKRKKKKKRKYKKEKKSKRKREDGASSSDSDVDNDANKKTRQYDSDDDSVSSSSSDSREGRKKSKKKKKHRSKSKKSKRER
eukprot:scaffold5294_cov72-Cyclotella_meneghiniana.AAC.10